MKKVLFRVGVIIVFGSIFLGCATHNIKRSTKNEAVSSSQNMDPMIERIQMGPIPNIDEKSSKRGNPEYFFDVNLFDKKRGILTPDGTYYLQDAGSGYVDIIDAKKMRLIRREKIHKKDWNWNVEVFGVSPDGKYIYSKQARMIRKWELETGKTVKTINYRGLMPKAALIDQGKSIVAATDRGLFFWDAKSGKQVAKLTTEHRLSSFALSKDKKELFALESSLKKGERRNYVSIYDLSKRKRIKRFLTHDANAYTTITLSPKGTYFIIYGVDNAPANVYIFDAQNGKKIYKIEHDKHHIMAQRKYYPDGRTVTKTYHYKLLFARPVFTEDESRLYYQDRGYIVVLDMKNFKQVALYRTVKDDGTGWVYAPEAVYLDEDTQRKGMFAKMFRNPLPAYTPAATWHRLIQDDKKYIYFDTAGYKKTRLRIVDLKKPSLIEIDAKGSHVDVARYGKYLESDETPKIKVSDSKTTFLKRYQKRDFFFKSTNSMGGGYIYTVDDAGQQRKLYDSNYIKKAFIHKNKLYFITFDSQRNFVFFPWNAKAKKKIIGRTFPSSINYDKKRAFLILTDVHGHKIYDLNKEKIVNTVRQKYAINGAVDDENGRLLTCSDYTIEVREMRSMKLLNKKALHNPKREGCFYHPKTTRLFLDIDAYGVIRLKDAVSFKLVATQYFTPDGEYIIFLPDGRFWGSKKAASFINVRKGRLEVEGLNNSYDTFYDPYSVKKVLSEYGLDL